MLAALLWNLLLTAGLAAVLAGLCCLPPLRRRPALKHWLWLLLLAKLVTPPLVAVPLLPAVGTDGAAATVAPVELVGSPLAAIERGLAKLAHEDSISAAPTPVAAPTQRAAARTGQADAMAWRSAVGLACRHVRVLDGSRDGRTAAVSAATTRGDRRRPAGGSLRPGGLRPENPRPCAKLRG